MSRRLGQLIVILVYFVSVEAKAQGSLQGPASISLGIGYFGELLTHPGVIVFTEIGQGTANNQVLTRLSFAAYKHGGHTRTIMVLPELVLRFNNQLHSYWEASLGLGAMRQKADHPVLEYVSGSFEKRESGWFYLVPSLGGRYGRNISSESKRPLIPNVGARLFAQHPFNGFSLKRLALDISVTQVVD